MESTAFQLEIAFKVSGAAAVVIRLCSKKFMQVQSTSCNFGLIFCSILFLQIDSWKISNTKALYKMALHFFDDEL